jgi:hypothetical protein
VNNLAIHESVILTEHDSIDAENLRGRGAFSRAELGRSVGGGFTIREVEQRDSMAICDHFGDRRSHSKFLVIRMRADDEHVHG